MGFSHDLKFRGHARGGRKAVRTAADGEEQEKGDGKELKHCN